MATFRICEFAEYEAFARDWPLDASDNGLPLRWQLLGELDPAELLIVLPEWLAEEKVEFTDGATPTEFVGRIERETEKAILLGDVAAAQPLLRLAHRIHHLQKGIKNAGEDDDRQEWLERRLAEKRSEFIHRDDMVGLQDGWLPKSQLIRAIRRAD